MSITDVLRARPAWVPLVVSLVALTLLGCANIEATASAARAASATPTPPTPTATPSPTAPAPYATTSARTVPSTDAR